MAVLIVVFPSWLVFRNVNAAIKGAMLAGKPMAALWLQIPYSFRLLDCGRGGLPAHSGPA